MMSLISSFSVHKNHLGALAGWLKWYSACLASTRLWVKSLLPPPSKKGRTTWSRTWWHTPVIPEFTRLRQEDCNFEDSLGYVVSQGQPGVHSETLSQNNNRKTSKSKQTNKKNHLILVKNADYFSFFFFVVLEIELRAYTLSHCISPFSWRVFSR
jgi:hypothetical protein